MTQRLSADEHKRKGTYRPHRHAPQTDRHGEPLDPRQIVSPAARQRVLAGLPKTAKAIATDLLNTYWNFDPAALFTLHAYALSCERLARLQAEAEPDHVALSAEASTNATFLKALRLPPEDD